MTIHAALADAGTFRPWRVAVRNLMDYRRVRDCGWREVGIWGWLGQDGVVRGVVRLGSTTTREFTAAFFGRWPMTLRQIEVAVVREEVWSAMRPGIIIEMPKRRYQNVRIAVEPQWERLRGGSLHLNSQRQCREEPMPVLI